MFLKKDFTFDTKVGASSSGISSTYFTTTSQGIYSISE
jgi:hypothetical protein